MMQEFTNAMTLGEMVAFMREAVESGASFSNGFCCPHSFAGDFSSVAFAPSDTTDAQAMLECAESAMNQTFTGFEGGQFTMSEDTPVWMAEEGECEGVRMSFETNEDGEWCRPESVREERTRMMVESW